MATAGTEKADPRHSTAPHSEFFTAGSPDADGGEIQMDERRSDLNARLSDQGAAAAPKWIDAMGAGGIANVHREAVGSFGKPACGHANRRNACVVRYTGGNR